MVLEVLVVVAISFFAGTVLVLNLGPDMKKRKEVVGTLCAIFAIAMFYSPCISIVRSTGSPTNSQIIYM